MNSYPKFSPGYFASVYHSITNVQCASDSDSESVNEEDDIATWENVLSPGTAEIIDEVPDTAEAAFQEEKMDAEDVAKQEKTKEETSSGKEQFIRDVFDEMSSLLMFPSAKLSA